MEVEKVIFLLIMFLGILHYGKPREDVIETARTEVIIWIGLGLLALLSILCFQIASIIFFGTDNPASYVPFFAVWLFPPVWAIASYILIPIYFRKKFKLVADDEDDDVREFVTTYSAQMGIPSPAIVYANAGPFVYGKDKYTARLVLPQDFSKKINDIDEVQGKEFAARAKEFIIRHELSHIKNRDFVFASWGEVFWSVMKFWIPFCYTIPLIYCVLKTDELVTILGITQNGLGTLLRIHIWLCSTVTLVLALLYLTFPSICRIRQYLADARASLNFFRKDLLADVDSESLIWYTLHRFSFGGTSSRKTSLKKYIKKIAFWFQGKWRRRFLYLYKFFFSTEPGRDSRAEMIENGTYSAPSDILLTKNESVWVGILVGLFLFMAMIGMLLSPCQVKIFSKNIYTLIGALGVFAASFIFCLPLKNSLHTEDDKKFYLGLFRQHFYGYLAAVVLVFLLMLPVTIWSLLFQTDEQKVLILIAIIPLYVAVIIFSVFIFSLAISFFSRISFYAFNNPEAIYIIKRSFIGAVLIGVFLAAEIYLLGITPFVAGVFLGMFVVIKWGILKTPYASVFEMYFEFNIGEYKISSQGVIKTVLISNAVVLIGLSPLIIIPLIIYFIPGINSLPKYQVTIYHLVIMAFGFVLLAYGSKNIFKAGEAIKLPLLAKYIQVRDVLERGSLLHGFEFDVNPSKSGGFSSTSWSLPDMKYTYLASFMLSACGREIPENTTSFVMSCTSNDGGFGVRPGARPSIVSTFHALETLNISGKISEIDNEKQAAFIASLQQQSGCLWDTRTKWSPIEETFFGMSALARLGKLEAIDRDALKSWLLKFWRSESIRLESACYLVCCLDQLGALEDDMKEQFVKKCLLPYRSKITNIKVDTHIDKVWAYTTIAVKTVDDQSTLSELLLDLPEKVSSAMKKQADLLTRVAE